MEPYGGQFFKRVVACFETMKGVYVVFRLFFTTKTGFIQSGVLQMMMMMMIALYHASCFVAMTFERVRSKHEFFSNMYTKSSLDCESG